MLIYLPSRIHFTRRKSVSTGNTPRATSDFALSILVRVFVFAARRKVRPQNVVNFSPNIRPSLPRGSSAQIEFARV